MFGTCHKACPQQLTAHAGAALGTPGASAVPTTGKPHQGGGQWGGTGRGKSGAGLQGGWNVGSFCHPLQSWAAKHGPPQLGTHSNMGAEKTHFCWLRSPQENTSSSNLTVPGSSGRHLGTAGLRIGQPNRTQNEARNPNLIHFQLRSW